MTDAEREWYEERAAIMEFDGGLSRAEAEKAAREALGFRLQALGTANPEAEEAVGCRLEAVGTAKADVTPAETWNERKAREATEAAIARLKKTVANHVEPVTESPAQQELFG